MYRINTLSDFEDFSFYRKGIFIRYALIIIFIIGLSYFFIWMFYDQTRIALFCLSNCVAAIIASFYKRLGISLEYVANIILGIGVLFITVVSASFIKEFPIFSCYFPFIPIASLLFNGKRETIIWTIVSGILLILCFKFDELMNIPLHFTAKEEAVMNYIQGSTVFILYISWVILYDYRQNRIIRTLIKQNALIQQSQEDLKRTQEFKDSFFSSVNHEIRTPMNAIRGISRLLLQSRMAHEGENKQLISALNTSSNHLLSIINDLLDMSKIEEGKLIIRNIDFDIRESVGSAIQIVEILAQEKSLDFEVEIDSKLAKNVVGDPPRINQIILNLLTNAVKFTSKGYVKLDMLLEDFESTNFIRVDVTDTGIGMDEKSGNVFDRFYQGEGGENIKYSGTGLGLNISKDLVVLMGGEIWYTSEKDVGSKFSFRIPYIVSENQEAILDPNTDVNNEAIVQAPNILIVDDSKVNVIIAKKQLVRFLPSDTTILEAENGQEALEIIREKKDIDLVLMDIQMPVLDGLETTRRLRKLEQYRDLPIIAMTANVSADDIRECKDAGMNNYIGKPFEIENLINIIKGYIKTERK